MHADRSADDLLASLEHQWNICRPRDAKKEGHSAPVEVGRRRYGMPDPAEDLDEPPLDERDLRGVGTPAFRRKRERFYEGH